MSNPEITQAVRDVLRRHGRLTQDVDGIADDADLYALGLTSHTTVNLVMALEDELDVEIPDDLLVKKTFSSIAGIRAAVESIDA